MKLSKLDIKLDEYTYTYGVYGYGTHIGTILYCMAKESESEATRIKPNGQCCITEVVEKVALKELGEKIGQYGQDQTVMKW